MAILKRKTVLVLFFVLAILIGLGLSYLPSLVYKTVNARKQLEFEMIDYHQTLDFSLGDAQKLDELIGFFPDVVANRGYKKINLILTDAEQEHRLFWMSSKNELINHFGYDVVVNEQSIDIYLYNNWSALSNYGWDSQKIQRENELLLIKILLELKGITGKQAEAQVKDIYLLLAKKYSQSLLIVTYAL